MKLTRLILLMLLFSAAEATVGKFFWNAVIVSQFGVAKITWTQAISAFLLLQFVIESPLLALMIRTDPAYRDATTDDFADAMVPFRVMFIGLTLVLFLSWSLVL